MATKEDIADLRGETRGLRRIMSGIGIGLAALTIVQKHLGWAAARRVTL